MNLQETKRQIFRAIANNQSKEVIAGIDLLIAEVERLRDDNERLSEQVSDLKTDIGWLRNSKRA